MHILIDLVLVQKYAQYVPILNLVDTECLICEQNQEFQRSLTRDEEISHSTSCVNSVDENELNIILPLQKHSP